MQRRRGTHIAGIIITIIFLIGLVILSNLNLDKLSRSRKCFFYSNYAYTKWTNVLKK